MQKGKALNVCREEILVFFGGLLLSGYTKCPNKRLYWSTEDDVPKILSDSIRCNRFEDILRNFQLIDNANILNPDDRLCKLRPLLEHLKLKFMEHGPLGEKMSVDESMIPYYGRHYAKQYIEGKPIRFGYKNWALCTSNGYLVNFDVYTGKSDVRAPSFFGVGGDIVIKLLTESIPPNLGYTTFFDNYFTSVKLLRHLHYKGYNATGTIRENRLDKCPLPDKKITKKEERGSYHYQSCKEVVVIQWKDNSVVTIASNYDSISENLATRWSNQKKQKVSIKTTKSHCIVQLGNGWSRSNGPAHCGISITNETKKLVVANFPLLF